MCGGVGSRFWPLSRTAMPKQFIDFFGAGRTLLQMTADRIRGVVPPERTVVVTNKIYADLVASQLPEIAPSNILCEPARRNTSPCICWAAHHIHALDPEASIVTLPSDHLILREEDFRNALTEGFGFVEEGDRLLTLGITPSSPHTGYGYIQLGAPVEGTEGLYKVKTFTEKPDAEMARIFINTGEFFWNSGIFIWSADSILRAFARYAPETASLFAEGDGIYATSGESDFIDRIFPTAPSISIDYAIMEKASNVYMKTVSFGWSDLGSWKALHDISPRTAEGNVTQNCRVITRDCSGSVFAVGSDKVVVASGLHDFIVAENGNALLICPISEEQKVRQMVNDVKTRFGEDYV